VHLAVGCVVAAADWVLVQCMHVALNVACPDGLRSKQGQVQREQGKCN
jgi:hypothetical protein